MYGGRTYDFEVRAVNAQGDGAPARATGQATLESSVPTGLSLSRTTRVGTDGVMRTTGSLSWTPPAQGEYTAHQFRLGRYPQGRSRIGGSGCAANRSFGRWYTIPHSGPRGENRKSFAFDNRTLGCGSANLTDTFELRAQVRAIHSDRIVTDSSPAASIGVRMPDTGPKVVGPGLGTGDVGSLEAGDDLIIRVMLDHPVRVHSNDGEPSFAVSIAGNERRAAFHAVVGRPRYHDYGSNIGSAIEFAYEMQASEIGTPEILVRVNALRATGGATITSATGGPAPVLANGPVRLQAGSWNAHTQEGVDIGTTTGDPLSATLESVPSSHDGETAFSLQVQFSEAIATGYEAVRDHAFTLTNAQLTNASRVDGRSDLWQLDVEPDSDAAVTLSVAANRECTESGALCTGDERSLSNALEATIAGPQETTALTAAFQNVPANHDGANEAFDVRILFDTRLSGSWTAVRDAISLTNATHTSTRRVDGRSDLWKIGINPTSDADVTVSLGASVPCGQTGALCSGDSRRFETAISTVIDGPDAEEEVETPVTPLTASLSGMPYSHDGETAFRFQLRFSEELANYSYRTMRDSSVVAMQGTTSIGASNAARVDGSNAHWEITITPQTDEAIAISFARPRDCTATGAMCTESGAALSSVLSATVKGPPGITVADATVAESTGATLDFELTLEHAPVRTVTLDYTTRDGSALAGSDYRAKAGTLSIAAGETSKTISVEVLSDSLDEGSETMTLDLSNASTGASLANETATGTITNDGPMPRAWLTRFGRTIASQAVDAIGDRINGQGRSHVRVGGIDLQGNMRAPQAEDGPRLGLEQMEWEDRQENLHSMSPQELLLGSTFQLSSGGGQGTGPVWTAWGHFATGGFDAQVDDTQLDGNVTSGFLGADVAGDKWLGGLALSMSTGDGDFSLMTDEDTGEVESTLTSVYPYARLSVSDKVDMWAMVGAGSGDIELVQHADSTRTEDQSITTDIGMRMGAIGIRGEVLSPEQAGGVSLAIKSDAFLVQMTSDAVRSSRGNLVATKSDASRVRLALEGARTWEAGAGRLTPSIEIGVRHDGGDAETGTGVELGGGLRYEGAGVSIEGAVRTLVTHEESGYEEWGASGAIRIDPGTSGRGLTLALAPSWGRAGSGMDQIWAPHGAHGLTDDEEFEAEHRLQAEIGYGLSVSRIPGVVTPYAGMTLGDSSGRAWRTGARWQMGTNATLGLEANTSGEDTGVTLRARLRF